MYEVEPIFVGAEFKTPVWMTEAVYEAIENRDKNKSPELLAKLKYYARSGFERHQCNDGRCPIRYEGGGVYRIGLKGDLFRVYGFYTFDGPACSSRCKEFIAVESHLKRGKKLTQRERDIVEKVKNAWNARNDGWRKIK